jgi:hypothetical protein
MIHRWYIVIFVVEGVANHVGVSIPGRGLADLSLRGARIIPWDAHSIPKGERIYFQLELPMPDQALDFLAQPGLLSAAILRQEKLQRGWHLSREAPVFVRTLRDSRSRDVEDMNCVEWIVYSLELGGLVLPNDIMTPAELFSWSLSYCRDPLPISEFSNTTFVHS